MNEFSLGDTSTFPVIVKNALNKRLENTWTSGQAGYHWWQKLVTVEHFDTLNSGPGTGLSVWSARSDLPARPAQCDRAQGNAGADDSPQDGLATASSVISLPAVYMPPL